MEFKDKIMLYCFREVKYKQGFTTGIGYYLHYALASQNSEVRFTSTNFIFTLPNVCSICFILRFFLLFLTGNDLIFLRNKRKH